MMKMEKKTWKLSSFRLPATEKRGYSIKVDMSDHSEFCASGSRRRLRSSENLTSFSWTSKQFVDQYNVQKEGGTL